MSDWIRYRTVIESKQASLSIESLGEKFDRFEAQWNGFVWLVSRNPEEISRKKLVNNTEYRLAHRSGDMNVGLPDISVIYTYDSDQVEIIDVEAWDNI